jgi:dTDP-4-amino-4,6-dideoxygalactose transaminase
MSFKTTSKIVEEGMEKEKTGDVKPKYLIPFRDLRAQASLIKEELLGLYEKIIDETDYVGAESPSSVIEFEQMLASYCGSEFAITVGNGTQALELALKALQIKGGDEVITVGNTFAATVSSIISVGATPRFIDIELDTGLIDWRKIEKAITDKTRVIIPVHLFGDVANMHEIMAIANKYGLYVIEDCAHAIGSRLDQKHVGLFGDIGCFSFYAGKNLGTIGEGGAIITKDLHLNERIKALRSHGTINGQVGCYVGTNARMGALEAATLKLKLKYLEKWNDKRRQLADVYRALLPTEAIPPKLQSNVLHSYHIFAVRVPFLDRSELIKALAERGVECRIHYPMPIFELPGYKYLNINSTQYVETRRLMAEIISLPLDPMMTKEHIKQVCNVLKEAISEMACVNGI